MGNDKWLKGWKKLDPVDVLYCSFEDFLPPAKKMKIDCNFIHDSFYFILLSSSFFFYFILFLTPLQFIPFIREKSRHVNHATVTTVLSWSMTKCSVSFYSFLSHRTTFNRKYYTGKGHMWCKRKVHVTVILVSLSLLHCSLFSSFELRKRKRRRIFRHPFSSLLLMGKIYLEEESWLSDVCSFWIPKQTQENLFERERDAI